MTRRLHLGIREELLVGTTCGTDPREIGAILADTRLAAAAGTLEVDAGVSYTGTAFEIVAVLTVQNLYVTTLAVAA